VNYLEKMTKFCEDIPFCYINAGFCVVSQPPIAIHHKGIVLHNEKEKAVSFADGWGVYALNGVRMDSKYIETPASQLSVVDVMEEQNVDVRREVLRKVGLDRFIKETGGKCLDTYEMFINGKKCIYQLLEISLDNETTARVLKMDNPSIDAMHVEGVEDTCSTVKEALAWRNGFDEYVEPKQLT
jgi:hypothetical protein